jgi:excisionase family DNA binding protein
MTQSVNEKLVFTLKEASASGFSMAFLRRKVEDGSLKSFRDGRTIKIARASLDEFARRGDEAR